MICQVSAEFTGAGVGEFHAPAQSPHSPPPAIAGRRLAAEGDGKQLRKSVCVCAWLNTHTR